MSKVSEAKATQGWRKKPDTCADCRHFTLDRIEEKTLDRIEEKGWSHTIWIREKNLRCSFGGFKTGKSNTCDRFERAPAAGEGAAS